MYKIILLFFILVLNCKDKPYTYRDYIRNPSKTELILNKTFLKIGEKDYYQQDPAFNLIDTFYHKYSFNELKESQNIVALKFFKEKLEPWLFTQLKDRYKNERIFLCHTLYIPQKKDIFPENGSFFLKVAFFVIRFENICHL